MSVTPDYDGAVTRAERAAAHAERNRNIPHGTHHGWRRCEALNPYLCPPCARARAEYEQALNIIAGRHQSVRIPVGVLALALQTDSPARAALLAELGHHVCDAIVQRATHVGPPLNPYEYLRLRAAGVNDHTAAVLAAHI